MSEELKPLVIEVTTGSVELNQIVLVSRTDTAIVLVADSKTKRPKCNAIGGSSFGDSEVIDTVEFYLDPDDSTPGGTTVAVRIGEGWFGACTTSRYSVVMTLYRMNGKERQVWTRPS